MTVAVARLVESVSVTREDCMFSTQHHIQLCVVAHVCFPSAQEVEAGGSGIRGHPQLHSVFEAGQGYMRPCLIKQVLHHNAKICNIQC